MSGERIYFLWCIYNIEYMCNIENKLTRAKCINELISQTMLSGKGSCKKMHILHILHIYKKMHILFTLMKMDHDHKHNALPRLFRG